MTKPKHTLIIRTLQDPDASCSCGRWHYSACSNSGDEPRMLKDQIKRAHRLHKAMEASK